MTKHNATVASTYLLCTACSTRDRYVMQMQKGGIGWGQTQTSGHGWSAHMNHPAYVKVHSGDCRLDYFGVVRLQSRRMCDITVCRALARACAVLLADHAHC